MTFAGGNCFAKEIRNPKAEIRKKAEARNPKGRIVRLVKLSRSMPLLTELGCGCWARLL